MVRLLLILLFLVGCGLGSGGALARESGRQDQGIFSPDAAAQDCRNIHVRQGTLVGECRQDDGRWRLMRLENVEECRGKQAREDNLACLDRGIPRGSYLESCRDVEVRGDDLRATCRRKGGNWRTTKLENFGSCEGEIRNRDGRLSC